MIENFEIRYPDSDTMLVQFKKPEMLDRSILGRIENDLNTLPFSISESRNDILIYSVKNLIPLSSFLEQYSFSQTEGYQFLINLLSKIASVHRTKPILLDLHTIFCSFYGDEIYFAAIPVALEYWMFQKEEKLNFINRLSEVFTTDDAFEIIGYLKMMMKKPGFSFQSLIYGLEDLECTYYPRSFWKRSQPYPPFRATHAIRPKQEFLHSNEIRADGLKSEVVEQKTHKPNSRFSFASRSSRKRKTNSDSVNSGRIEKTSLNRHLKNPDPEMENSPYQMEEHLDSKRNDQKIAKFDSENRLIGSNQPTRSNQVFYDQFFETRDKEDPFQNYTGLKEEVFQSDPFSALTQTSAFTESTETSTEAPTQLLIIEPEASGWIEIKNRRYSLSKAETIIGRHPDCDIVLNMPDVSGHHARILFENGRYYLSVLNSRNGTFIEDHQVIRKMRLREGMHLRFSSQEAIFHEKQISV
ncbi:FHA domain-containing protein [Ileibacterium valens]|uniref:FHA domain-containing protein n=1 Tax=Ileibacterium valens TaxID=1862668 RepID=UPI0023571B5F|nr:FHA domain-containing protein [Ileibacterium valens]